MPLLAEIENPTYQESNQTLSYSTSLTKEKIYEFYAAALPKKGWKQSIPEVTITDGKEILSYRNPSNDMLVLSIAKQSDSEIKVELMHQTVAAMNKRLDEQAAAYKKNRNIP